MTLAQLEETGFVPTEAETEVLEHPSFQYLRNNGWPLKWGTLLTGRKPSVFDPPSGYPLRFEVAVDQLLTAHAAGELTDTFVTHTRAVHVLVASLSRDIDTCIPSNDQLLKNLCLWLNQDERFHRFRWEEHERVIGERLQTRDKLERVRRLQEGEADVLVILPTRLLQAERVRVHDAIEASCISRGVFAKDDEARQFYHIPPRRCLSCSSQHERCCQQTTSIVAIDCGDIKSVMSNVDRNLQRHLRIVQFSVPRSLFSSIRQYEGIFAQFYVFGMDPLSAEEQSGVTEAITRWLQKQQADEQTRATWQGDTSTIYRPSQVILPNNSARTHAVLLAGGAAMINYWYESVKDDSVAKDRLATGELTVSYAGYY